MIVYTYLADAFGISILHAVIELHCDARKAMLKLEQFWTDVLKTTVSYSNARQTAHAAVLKTVFFLAQAVARHFVMQKSGGEIINIASMLSFQGGVRVPSDTAAKSGVPGLTRLLVNEWAERGINVNAIAAGDMAARNRSRCATGPRADRLYSVEPVARAHAKALCSRSGENQRMIKHASGGEKD